MGVEQECNGCRLGTKPGQQRQTCSTANGTSSRSFPGHIAKNRQGTAYKSAWAGTHALALKLAAPKSAETDTLHRQAWTQLQPSCCSSTGCLGALPQNK